MKYKLERWLLDFVEPSTELLGHPNFGEFRKQVGTNMIVTIKYWYPVDDRRKSMLKDKSFSVDHNDIISVSVIEGDNFQYYLPREHFTEFLKRIEEKEDI